MATRAKTNHGMPAPKERRRRLREAALRAPANARFWYQDAEREIRTVARAWGVDPVFVAVAVAATSPATAVISSPRMTRGGGSSSNIGKARRVVKALAAGKSALDVINPRSPGATLLKEFESCHVADATPYECLERAFPNPETTKTHAFIRNLLGDTDAVTVDRLLAAGVGVPAGANGEARVSPARYRAVAADVRAVAAELGWQPREVMAAAWTAWGGSGALTLATTRERVIQERLEEPLTEETLARRYRNLGMEQRDAPEAAMGRIQKTHSGVLGFVVEHGGDVMHRMNEWFVRVPFEEAIDRGRSATVIKAEKVLRALRPPREWMPFAEEHRQNVTNNAAYHKQTMAQYNAPLDAALAEYAAEHAKLPAYNRLQELARSAAVALGEKKFNLAATHYAEILRIAKDPDEYRRIMRSPLDVAVEPTERLGPIGMALIAIDLIIPDPLPGTPGPITFGVLAADAAARRKAAKQHQHQHTRTHHPPPPPPSHVLPLPPNAHVHHDVVPKKPR